MWTPAIASVVARLALREGFSDVSFRWGGGPAPAIALAWTFPLVVGFLAYGLAWATGLRSSAPRRCFDGFPPSAGSRRDFSPSVLLSATLGSLSAVCLRQVRKLAGAATCSRG